jgi:hypothetical protein
MSTCPTRQRKVRVVSTGSCCVHEGDNVHWPSTSFPVVIHTMMGIVMDDETWLERAGSDGRQVNCSLEERTTC